MKSLINAYKMSIINKKTGDVKLSPTYYAIDGDYEQLLNEFKKIYIIADDEELVVTEGDNRVQKYHDRYKEAYYSEEDYNKYCTDCHLDPTLETSRKQYKAVTNSFYKSIIEHILSSNLIKYELIK